jgi:O-antigen/teichoic acid export membrane protein
MMQMNSRANVMVGTLLYPLLAFAFAFADDIVSVVYTASYVEAAPVMRVYIVGMAAMVIEMGSIVLLLAQGGFAVRIAAVALAVSVGASWTAAHHFGLAGAAVGSVIAVYLDRFFMLRRVSAHTAIPLRELQDWRGLFWTLVSAALAAGLAWVVVDTFVSQRASIIQLAVGAAVLALAYIPIHFWRAAR